MKKNVFMPAIVLCSICVVVALLLSGVNMITGPIIAAQQNAAANEALLEVLPEGKNFEEIEITSDYPAIVTAGYKADGGFVFQMNVTGKSAGLVIMCGIDSEGKVVGTKVIANEETPSYAENTTVANLLKAALFEYCGEKLGQKLLKLLELRFIIKTYICMRDGLALNHLGKVARSLLTVYKHGRNGCLRSLLRLEHCGTNKDYRKENYNNYRKYYPPHITQFPSYKEFWRSQW